MDKDNEMPEPISATNAFPPPELAALIGKQAHRIARQKSGRIEPNSTVLSVLFYTNAAGMAHDSGWHVCIEQYNHCRLVVPLVEFTELWSIVK
jgi:hypothetical protein